MEFALPKPPNGHPWSIVLRTENIEDPFAEETLAEKIIVGGRALVLLSDGKPA